MDDDPDVRRIVLLALRLDAGIEVEEAAGGLAALRMLREGPAPDCILLDAEMPDLNGQMVATALRSQDALAHIPVIFLTGRAALHETWNYLALGATGTIAKPFDPLTLAGQVRAILARPASRAAGGDTDETGGPARP